MRQYNIRKEIEKSDKEANAELTALNEESIDNDWCPECKRQTLIEREEGFFLCSCGYNENRWG